MATEDLSEVSQPTAATTKDDDGVSFTEWREANINDASYQRDDIDGAEGKDDVGSDENHFFLFGEDDEEDAYEEIRYEYEIPSSSSSSSMSSPSPSDTSHGGFASGTAEVVLRHHGAYPNATGLAVWRGAQILARFLCDQERRRACGDDEGGVVSVRGKSVLEVGAGAGLPGIVAHRVLGATRVLASDGDCDALANLRTNVDRNRLPESTTTTSSSSITCVQLIWGRSIEAFAEAHGRQDVVLAADCVYMRPSLAPLWATLDALLKPDGVFVYCQTAASAVSWKLFSEQVEAHDFEVRHRVVGAELRKYDVDDEDSGDEDDRSRREGEEYEQGVYVFRRRR